MDYRPLRTTRNYSSVKGRPDWYRIENVAAGPAQAFIYDEIGFFGVAADAFLAEVGAIKGDIDLHINSPGGDVHSGIAIYNQLRQRPGTLSVVVDGLAASAASFIAMAASPGRLAMAPHSQMMIHNGFGMAIGDADDMEQMAGLLRKTTSNIAGIYADRTGKPAEYWLPKMAAETWYDDHEAVADGLADYILGHEPKNKWDLSVYAHAPADAVNKDYSADERKASAAKGHAMPDGSFPIEDEEDLHNAIHLAGNAKDPPAARRHIIKRAKALGKSDTIPDNWNADGSVSSLSETEILAMFASELDQLDAGKEQ